MITLMAIPNSDKFYNSNFRFTLQITSITSTATSMNSSYSVTAKKCSRSNDQHKPTTIRGEPWYNDGNILVQADGGTQFRVHQGVLKGILEELDKI
jgi:hypothetical protein